MWRFWTVSCSIDPPGKGYTLTVMSDSYDDRQLYCKGNPLCEFMADFSLPALLKGKNPYGVVLALPSGRNACVCEQLQAVRACAGKHATSGHVHSNEAHALWLRTEMINPAAVDSAQESFKVWWTVVKVKLLQLNNPVELKCTGGDFDRHFQEGRCVSA